MNIVKMDGIIRMGKNLMGSSDLAMVVHDQKTLHESQTKILPLHQKVSGTLLKWSYTESNADIPNLFSCWADLDHALQTLAQENIEHSVGYRKVFKDINAEGKRLTDFQKEKESSAKKVTSLKKQIESLRKSKKGADRVKLGNFEAELALAQSKDSEMAKEFIAKTKEFEDYKATVLRESSMAFCDNLLETLDRVRQVYVAKREVASVMCSKPVYNGDRVSQDGMNAVDDVFKILQLQLPARDATLDRNRCFGLGTRSSSFSQFPEPSSSATMASPRSPKQQPKPQRSPPATSASLPRNLTSLQPGHTGTLGSMNSLSSDYQGGEDLGMSSDSGDEHDYQVPNDDYFRRKKLDTSMASTEEEEEYLAPQFLEPSHSGPLSGGPGPRIPPGPRVPPRQESMQSHSSDSSIGTSHRPGDYVEVLGEASDHEEPRMPPGSTHSRSSTDSSTSNGSTGPGRPAPIKLPRVMPNNNNSLEVTEGEVCWRDKSPGTRRKTVEEMRKEKEMALLKEKKEEMLKRKPAPLPKPGGDAKPKPKPKPKPGSGPGPGRDRPGPVPRMGSSEQDTSMDSPDDTGGFYEIMNAADAQRLQMAKSKAISTYDPEIPPHQEGTYYSHLPDEDSDSDSDYCVAGCMNEQAEEKYVTLLEDNDDGYFPLINEHIQSSTPRTPPNFSHFNKAENEEANEGHKPDSGASRPGFPISKQDAIQEEDEDSEDNEAIYCNL